MKNTKIEWCDDTLNPVSGCSKVSAGCQNCYAETLARRFPKTFGQWGDKEPRRFHPNALREALRLNRRPMVCKCGYSWQGGCCGQCLQMHRRRIFWLSMGDWLDPHWPVEYLARMLDTIRQCSECVHILCTKRPERWRAAMGAVLFLEHERESGPLWKWVAAWVCGESPQNVIILTSVEDQKAADKRIPELLRIPAAVHGLSLEPLLGPVDLTRKATKGPASESWLGLGEIGWLIIGGESGPAARPCNVEWVRSLVQQGKAAGVPVFVKQLGSRPFFEHDQRQRIIHDPKGSDPVEWPEDLRVRGWPA